MHVSSTLSLLWEKRQFKEAINMEEISNQRLEMFIEFDDEIATNSHIMSFPSPPTGLTSPSPSNFFKCMVIHSSPSSHPARNLVDSVDFYAIVLVSVRGWYDQELRRDYTEVIIAVLYSIKGGSRGWSRNTWLDVDITRGLKVLPEANNDRPKNVTCIVKSCYGENQTL